MKFIKIQKDRVLMFINIKNLKKLCITENGLFIFYFYSGEHYIFSAGNDQEYLIEFEKFLSSEQFVFAHTFNLDKSKQV